MISRACYFKSFLRTAISQPDTPYRREDSINMAGPPPPPLPPPGVPSITSPSPMAGGREALFGDIHKGIKLKKAVTIDKSKPSFDLKSSISTGKPPAISSSSSSTPALVSGGPPQLGNLFAGGMPKLKSVSNTRHDRSPMSAPVVPPIPGAVSSSISSASNSTPMVPSSRSLKKNLASAVPGVNAPPPPVANSVPPLPVGIPPPLAPSVPLPPSQVPPVPSLAPSLPENSMLRVPKVPPNRPRKLNHMKRSSLVSASSAGSVNTPEVPRAPSSMSPPNAAPSLLSAPPPPLNFSSPPHPLLVPSLSLVAYTPNLTGNSSSHKSPKSAPGDAGGLPFLVQTNAGRDESFVVDGSNSDDSGNSSTNLPSIPSAPPLVAPPIPTGLPPLKHSALAKPEQSSSVASAPLAPFLDQINARRSIADSINSVLKAASFEASPLVPPITPSMAPPVPQTNSSTNVTPVIPPPARAVLPARESAPQPLPINASSALAPPSPPASLPPSVPSQAPELPVVTPSPPRGYSGTSRLSQKAKAAPPPPPASKLDDQQSAGSSLRKISALQYTLSTLSTPEKIVIEDKRFKFANSKSLPQPRRFEGLEKLYPSGRGSSVPLNLSQYT